MKPLAVIRPARTRGPWIVCTSDGGAILFQTRSWPRAVEVSRSLIEALTCDYHIDAMEATC
ncbi:hypothetical protein [Microbacterium sp.]|uniref:hypothetical protein n=1 Tax=Microbacterium sp. TaxID=51671 RepID=UPI003F9A2958